MNFEINYPAELIILIALIVTFFQSGIDKIVDWKGNLSWLKEHFSGTLLQHMVPLALGTILLVEVAAALVMLFGAYGLITNGSKQLALLGLVLGAAALIMLLFGQRIAKDYDGARTIVIYLILNVVGVYLLAG